jgi:hypothetical protein
MLLGDLLARLTMRTSRPKRRGKTDGANRRAFDRALKALSEKSEISIKRKDGDDCLYQSRPIEAEKAKSSPLFDG